MLLPEITNGGGDGEFGAGARAKRGKKMRRDGGPEKAAIRSSHSRPQAQGPPRANAMCKESHQTRSPSFVIRNVVPHVS